MSAQHPFARGGVWTADHGGRAGRPVVIVTDDALCGVFARSTVAGVISTRRGVPGEVEIRTAEGLAEGSIVNALDLTTVPTDSLRGYRGQLDATRLRALDAALGLVLGPDAR